MPTPGPDRSGRAQRIAARLAGTPLFWLLLLGIIFVVPLGRTLARDVPQGPSMRVPLPEFQLTDQRGEPFGLAKLRGKVWVADFIFTSCGVVCPKLTKRMAELQHRTRNLGDAFHLVSFTVDPDNDTPERLAAYAREYRASPHRWTFLTGTLGDIETTVVKGFKTAMGKEEADPGIFSIFHGERFVLVDRKGAIRGYYEATDEGLDQLVRDIGIISNLD
jgi:protein SCO1